MNGLFETRDDIPLMAVLTEFTVAIITFYVTVRVFQKYLERRNKALAYLYLNLFFTSLPVFLLASGKALDYFGSIPRRTQSFTDFTIVISYMLTAIANIFAIGFYNSLFSKDTTINRRLTFFSILNGMTIGMLINHISFNYGVYAQIAPIILYHVIISTITYGLLIKSSFQVSKKTSDRLGRIGLRLIGLFGLGVILTFVFFALDLITGVITGGGYTIFYYLAWIVVAISAIVAYLGYVMPSWFKNWLTR
ncbi:MAG: hypothetical protein D6732_18785 [Methanobacteriota archaeon]|nr:MAG: hypothetical protein D6732_18785 [Euryarchaeota archaeon]